jgi:hypothetical protein
VLLDADGVAAVAAKPLALLDAVSEVELSVEEPTVLDVVLEAVSDTVSVVELSVLEAVSDTVSVVELSVLEAVFDTVSVVELSVEELTALDVVFAVADDASVAVASLAVPASARAAMSPVRPRAAAALAVPAIRRARAAGWVRRFPALRACSGERPGSGGGWRVVGLVSMSVTSRPTWSCTHLGVRCERAGNRGRAGAQGHR